MLEKKKKIYIYLILKYANCIGVYAANFLYCISTYKAETNARKKQKAKKIQKKELANNIGNKEGEEKRKFSPQLDMDMELKEENWASNSTPTLVKSGQPMIENTRLHQLGKDAQREQKNGHVIWSRDVIT